MAKVKVRQCDCAVCVKRIHSERQWLVIEHPKNLLFPEVKSFNTWFHCIYYLGWWRKE